MGFLDEAEEKGVHQATAQKVAKKQKNVQEKVEKVAKGDGNAVNSALEEKLKNVPEHQKIYGKPVFHFKISHQHWRYRYGSFQFLRGVLRSIEAMLNPRRSRQHDDVLVVDNNCFRETPD